MGHLAFFICSSLSFDQTYILTMRSLILGNCIFSLPHSPLSFVGNLQRVRSNRGKLHRGSNRTQAPIGFKRSTLAQMRRVGKRLPDFFRRVAQLSDENERPFLSVLSYLRPAGRTRCVLLAIGHRLLLVFLFVGVD